MMIIGKIFLVMVIITVDICCVELCVSHVSLFAFCSAVCFAAHESLFVLHMCLCKFFVPMNMYVFKGFVRHLFVCCICLMILCFDADADADVVRFSN